MDGYDDYDVIVIGSGSGGLTAAAYLAHAGRRVLVVEARDQVGGHMSSFTHDGCEFDIGLHYTSEAPVQEVLRPLGVDVRFRAVDPDGMFRLLGPDREVVVPQGVEAFRARLHEAFPAERATVDTFLATVEMLSAELDRLRTRPALRDLPRLPWQLRGLARYGASTAGGYLDSLHASPALRHALLGWVVGSVGLPPSRLSLPVAASLVRHYLDGLAYPQGGARVITEALADVVRRHRGQVQLGTEVSRILVDHDRVRGVQLRSASLAGPPEPVRDVLAPAVVSAVDVRQTYVRLLPPGSVPSRVTRRVAGYESALPLAVVYLVLDRDLAAEGFRHASYAVTDAYDLDGMFATLRSGELPTAGSAGVWLANLADPDNPRLCRPGQTNLQLIGVAPPQQEWWGVAPGSGPTPRYLARKRQVRDQLVRTAARAVPGLSDAIVHEETATPITDARLMRTTDGTSYGPAFTPRQTFTRLGPKGPLAGLFHAGAGVQPAHGLVGTLHGGVAAAAAVTGVTVAELLAGAAGAQPVPSG